MRASDESVRTVVGCDIAIASPGHPSANPDRHGTVVGVIGEQSYYLVRWSNGGSTVIPATECVVVNDRA